MHGWGRGARRGRGRGFAPWGGGRGRFFGPGEVRLALLSLLKDGPKHGYELMKLLEERSGGGYQASAGTVYPTLQQLEDEGLVRSDPAEGKRTYHLTQDGLAELDRETEAVGRIWQRAEDWGDFGFAWQPEAAEIAGPAFRLARAALRVVARSGADPEMTERVREILERARREIERLRK